MNVLSQDLPVAYARDVAKLQGLFVSGRKGFELTRDLEHSLIEPLRPPVLWPRWLHPSRNSERSQRVRVSPPSPQRALPPNHPLPN